VKNELIRSKNKIDILDLIKKDHRQVETLFKEIENTNNNQELYNCFNELIEKLIYTPKLKSKHFTQQYARVEIITN
jgi:hemerythrin superfamily protein